MKKFLLTALAISGLTLGVLGTVKAADEKKEATSLTGVLIDNKCGKGKNEEKAAGHDIACSVKCAKSGYQVIVGDDHYAIDEKLADKAKSYLEDAKSSKVTITGKIEDKKITAIDSIKAASK